MIGYFDTSALVPLLIDEPTTENARAYWRKATSIVAAALLYPEARSALARAAKTRRISATSLGDREAQLDGLLARTNVIAVDAPLAVLAGELAGRFGLSGADASHLAAATSVGQAVLVAGDRALCEAAYSLGLHVAEL